MRTALLPPGPKRRILGGNLFDYRRDPVGFLLRAANECGDVASMKMGPYAVFLLNHPDYVRDVLVTHDRLFKKGRVLERAKRVLGEGLLTSEGDHHLRQRRLAQPAFHRQRIAGYAASMVEYAARARGRWRNGETLDVHEEMMRLTLAIAGKTLFDADVEQEAGDIAEALNIFVGMFPFLLIPFSEFLEKLPIPALRRVEKSQQRLDAILYRIIAQRRASERDQGDLLSMLLHAQDVEGDGQGMSDQQLRDECLTLILAGHETTAVALTWTWYLLSQHPEVEAKLHAELAAVLGGRLPVADDLPQLRYTEQVLAESMRMYPPAWAVGRRALEPYPVAGYVLPKGCIVILSQYVMHHDSRYYPDPFRFDPERWTPEERAQRPKFSYFPFGAGPRQCIGESFAWMEGTLLLATLAQQWKLRLAPGHPVAMLPVITLRPKHGMKMSVERHSARSNQ